ncbi:MAG: thiamine phosphate synthase [Phycisphaerae bacterium]
MVNPQLLRIVDANANRAREALRVLEDYSRFALNDAKINTQLKHLRHQLAQVMQQPELSAVILARDTAGDVGTDIKTPQELTRTTAGAVVIAAGKRLSEALRSMEESCKVICPAVVRELETMRYAGYDVEKVLARTLLPTAVLHGVYVLLTESLCVRPWQDVLHAVLAAGASMVQLREKSLPDAELLARATYVAQACRQAGAVALINDRPDIAVLAGAHGVHVGQTDLPCAQLRRGFGAELLVGVSTEAVAQAQTAVADGASYVAVGPMYASTTKTKPRVAGPEYLQAVRAVVARPIVAIGGITPERSAQLRALGADVVAVCGGIIADADPAVRCREYVAAMGPATGGAPHG